MSLWKIKECRLSKAGKKANFKELLNVKCVIYIVHYPAFFKYIS